MGHAVALGELFKFFLNSDENEENLFRDDGLQEVPDLSRFLTCSQESII